ncbi:MAG TPA: carboxypeptidase-like regulatory domain-containing protein, partial [Bacteroidales bacterium]|nr:carboxypeptidase-like regulatory domain-containing protein [Bacteroidales bacterium]
MRYPLAIAIIFLISSFNTGAAQGYITGKITDSKTHEPLYGVYVISGKHVATSDMDGHYVVATDTGEITVNFRLIGYKSITKDLYVHPADSMYFDTAMDMDLREIGQIVVSANKSEQKIAELTVSMDVLRPADIAGNHIIDAQELINKTPGIEIMDGQAS